jgi:hypothetical protein
MSSSAKADDPVITDRMARTGWSALADHDSEPAETTLNSGRHSIGDDSLTFVTDIVPSSPVSFPEGTFARVLSKVEQERCSRAALRPAPGRLRASFTPVLRPVREVRSLDWDRQVTPAGSHVPGSMAWS